MIDFNIDEYYESISEQEKRFIKAMRVETKRLDRMRSNDNQKVFIKDQIELIESARSFISMHSQLKRIFKEVVGTERSINSVLIDELSKLEKGLTLQQINSTVSIKLIEHGIKGAANIKSSK